MFEPTTNCGSARTQKMMMTPDSKKGRIDDDQAMEENDRISNLPSHLISCILDCMLIKAAARTCTLSKTWKNVWEAYPHIVLPFFIDNQLIEVVNSILLAHKGPILKFVLYIPSHLHLNHSQYPLLWMKQVSDKGVRVLNLCNAPENPTINMPSYFFLCSELTSLTVTNWKLSPPPKFEGFRKLTSLHLSYVTITAEMSFEAQVQNFSLENCAGIEHMDRQLTSHNKSIKTLSIIRSPQMERHYATGIDYNPFTCAKKSFNLYRILDNMHSVENLTLNGTCLMLLDPSGLVYYQLTTTMKNLKTLMLVDVAFNYSLVIANVFCLLRSFSNLKVLKITVGPDSEIKYYLKITSEQYLEPPYCQNITLNQLQTVEVQGMVGSRAELLFIKFLLASSPLLRRMKLVRKTTLNDPKEELRIARELLQFPRTSPVEIFWR